MRAQTFSFPHSPPPPSARSLPRPQSLRNVGGRRMGQGWSWGVGKTPIMLLFSWGEGGREERADSCGGRKGVKRKRGRTCMNSHGEKRQ